MQWQAEDFATTSSHLTAAMLAKVLPLVLVLSFGSKAEDDAIFRPTNAMEAVKGHARTIVARYYCSTMDSANESKGMVGDYNAWIQGSREMQEKVANASMDLTASVSSIADELIRVGEENGKPEGYFECVRRNRNSAVAAIEKVPPEYEREILAIWEASVSMLAEILLSLRTTMDALPAIHKDVQDTIDSCNDMSCIESIIRNGSIVIGHARLLILDVTLSASKEFGSFTGSEYTKASERVTEMKAVHDEGIVKMNQC